MRKKLTRENLEYWKQYIADVKSGRVVYSFSHDVPEVVMRAIRFDTSEFAANRRRLGYTQKDVANLIGVSVNTYRAWERQTGTPGAAHRRLLVDLFSDAAPPELSWRDIRFLRLARQQSISAFARSFGVSFATAERWENGYSTPRPAAARALADAFQKAVESGVLTPEDLALLRDNK